MRRPAVGLLRRIQWLRSVLVCLLAAVLLTGAATYSQGTRYDLPGSNFAQASSVASEAEPETMTDDCREPRHAPRGEPAPLRTGAVDPPPLVQWQPGGAVPSTGPPAEPEVHALTLTELSISRT